MNDTLEQIADRRWGDCRLCRLLRNPFYAPGPYIARFAVNLATVIWSAIVLWKEDALGGDLYVHHRQMTELMPEDAWARVGRHTESGRYGAEDWLNIYAEHLEVHAAQIEANVTAWRGRAT